MRDKKKYETKTVNCSCTTILQSLLLKLSLNLNTIRGYALSQNLVILYLIRSRVGAGKGSNSELFQDRQVTDTSYGESPNEIAHNNSKNCSRWITKSHILSRLSSPGIVIVLNEPFYGGVERLVEYKSDQLSILASRLSRHPLWKASGG